MPTPEDTDRKPATLPPGDPADDVEDPASALDGVIQDRADMLKEAMAYEAVGRLMLRSIVGFLSPDQGPGTAGGESWRVSDATESDDITEAARNAARRAAYARLIRIFESDLPHPDDVYGEDD